MARRRRQYWTKAALALALLVFTLPAGLLRAQEGPRPGVAAKAQAQPASNAAKAEAAKAESEEKGGGEADAIRHSPAVKFIAGKTGLSIDQAYWLCIGFNFAVVFSTIAILLRKKLPGFFSGRTAAIQKGIEEARKTSEEARCRLNEVEGRLSRLDTEIAAMRREAEENAKADEERMLAAGEEERRRIVASAEQEIEMAANAARRDLKSYVAELAVELAEKKIRVSKDADEALVRAFTAELGKDGN